MMSMESLDKRPKKERNQGSKEAAAFTWGHGLACAALAAAPTVQAAGQV
jgi:hypothetical protein